MGNDALEDFFNNIRRLYQRTDRLLEEAGHLLSLLPEDKTLRQVNDALIEFKIGADDAYKAIEEWGERYG